MQRQSLGSPGSKLNSHGGGDLAIKERTLRTEDNKKKEEISASSLTDDEAERKSQKLLTSSPSRSSEKYIHFIPVVILVCFLILYLSSHYPSPKDMAQFNGFRQSSKFIGPKEIDDFEQSLEIQKRDVLAIRSLRNLKDVKSQARKYRLNRKIGDF